MKRPFMQEDLREHKLLAILDLLMESEEPLTVGQIQYRLGRDRNIEMTRDEIEAHLKWGLHQPGATNAPVRPIPRPQNTWMVVAKVPSIAEQIEAAGPPLFETKAKPRMSEYGIFNCKECGSRCRVWKGSLSYKEQLCAVCLDKAGLGVPL